MKFTRIILGVLSSQKFFYILIGLFLVQALWIAFTAIYPMAFDENFHLGIIQYYATGHFTPFLGNDDQPINPGPLGELIHDPSYLFHYLMSFPYRLSDVVTHNQTINIIFLRLIDIAIFTGGLVLFRKLLLQLGASKALTNMALFITIFIPITPFLAGQINYDDLIVLVTPLLLLVTIRAIRSIIARHQFSFLDLSLIAIIGMLGGLVKYAFLPIVAACVVAILFVWLRDKKRGAIWRSLGTTFLKLSLWLKITLIVGIAVSLGLFGQRYFYNLATYHSIQPDCADVLTIEQCQLYGPWGRDYGYKQGNIANHTYIDPNPIPFLGAWIYGMTHRLYFTINHSYENYPGLPLPTVTAVIACLVGLLSFIVFFRRIMRAHKILYVPLFVIAIYILSLLLVDYSSYLHTNVYAAINGRYLIPLMPVLVFIIGLGWRELIRLFKAGWQTPMKVWLTVAVILLTLDGGGAISFIYFAEPSNWYWPHGILNNFNEWLRGIVRPLIIHYRGIQ